MLAKNIAKWSQFVRERDGKCVKCGKVDDLHAHHIQPKSLYPDLMLETDNGVTLCYSCHRKSHEGKRPLRIRSERPHRDTLMAKRHDLEKRLSDALYAIDALGQKLHDAEVEILVLQAKLGRKLCQR